MTPVTKPPLPEPPSRVNAAASGETDLAREVRSGALAAIACYCIWGFCPLFWSLLGGVNSIEIIGQRIIWSLVLTVLACRFVLKADFISLLRDARA